MDDQIIEPQYVTLVNRLSETREFWGFGRPHVFTAGESRAVSRPFAQWIFTRTNGPMLTHTVEASYVCWLRAVSPFTEKLIIKRFVPGRVPTNSCNHPASVTVEEILITKSGMEALVTKQSATVITLHSTLAHQLRLFTRLLNQ